MKKSILLFCCCSAAVLLLTSCISAEYTGKSFAPTASLTVLQGKETIKIYEYIGSGKASGEYSGTSNAELQHKLYKLGLQHGAEAMKIVGVRLVPEGFAVDTADQDFIEAVSDTGETQSEFFMQETISGNPNRGYDRYLRIMYADFYRKKID